MNSFNDDKKALEGRKNPLPKEIKVGLRDQIVKKLFNKLEDEKIGLKVSEAWNTETARIANHLQRQQVYLKDLDEHLEASADQPFAGSSNLHLPMPFTVCKTYHARFLQALLGVDPPFSVKPRREDATDKVQVIEDLMRYTLADYANHYRGIDEVLDGWLWNWVTTGTGIVKARWATEFCRYTDIKAVPKPGAPRIVVDETGKEVVIPTVTYEEQESPVTINKFKGPVVELVNDEDFISVGSSDPDLADLVIHRTYMTASDLWSEVDQGRFNWDAVEEIIRSGEDRKSAAIGGNIKNQRSEYAGKASVDTETDLTRYEILEAYLKLDVDGSGINSDVIVWTHADTGCLLRATYLYRVMPTGERPFSVIHFHKRPGEERGVGLLEILHPLSVELDAMHNMRIDFGMISNLPFFFYRASSGLDPETMQLEPGVGIPLDNPQNDVVFPQMSNRTAFGAQEEMAIQTYVERLTGISDLSLGVMTGSQGATRTASGVRALMGESNSNLDVHLRRLNRGWKKVLKLIFHLLQTRMDAEFVFRITGEDGGTYFRKIFNYEIAAEVDFEINANSANSNKSVQIEVAQTLVQVASNPLYIQLGITGPNEAYNALKNYLSALGVKDVHRYIKRPQAYSYSLIPEEEFNRVMRGQDVPVSPEMDHDGFIAFAKTMLESQQDSQTMDDQQQALVMKQMKAHMQMKQALEQQAAQQAVSAQMQMNAQMSQNQAPPALNPLAGSAPGQLPSQ